MKVDDPRDLSPLSYGTGLAMGLMLILGLPAEKPRPKQARPPEAPVAKQPLETAKVETQKSGTTLAR